MEEERSHLLDFFEDQDAMWRVEADLDGSQEEDFDFTSMGSRASEDPSWQKTD